MENNIISAIDISIIELIKMYKEVPVLLSDGKNMAAIQMVGFIDNEIMNRHEDLISIYSMVFSGFKVFNSANSNVIDSLKSKKIVSSGFFSLAPGFLKTWGMYFYSGESIDEGKSQQTYSNQYKIALGNFNSKYNLPNYSSIPDIVMHEIEFLIYALSDIVEPDWPEEEDSIEEDEKINRHIPKEVKLYVWRRDQGKCCNCGSKEKLEYDHIIPVSKGGSNTERNIQLLCEKCNRSKSSKIA